VNTQFTCVVCSQCKSYLFVGQFNLSNMSEMSEYVSRAKSAFDEKFVNDPTSSEQKMKFRKRKLGSEPIFLRKKVRLLNRVSEKLLSL